MPELAAEDAYWIALNRVLGAGRVTFHKLVRHFGNAREVFSASQREIRAVDRHIGEKLAARIAACDPESEVAAERQRIERCKATVLTLNNSQYPVNLKAIYDPPPVLYVLGEVRMEDLLSISIVGTRRPTRYGRNVASMLAKGLAERGLTIVSGMARGIDSFAHRGALEGSGRTIGVLGCGVDVVYPAEQGPLRDRIVRSGAILSEFPMGTRPNRGNFPMRNRVISGLSLGTMVVEGGAGSGALITASIALEQGREVFSVPGCITTSASAGTNRLIREGAKVVTCVEDVVEEFSPQVQALLSAAPSTPAEEEALAPEEKRVYSLVTDEEQHIDFLIAQSGLPAAEMSSILVRLELAGLVKQHAGKLFVRAR